MVGNDLDLRDDVLARLRESYGIKDIGCLENFQGNFINFGYWDQQLISNDHVISLAERIAASRQLYDLVLKRLTIQSKDIVLEVGCGRGGKGVLMLLHTINLSRFLVLTCVKSKLPDATSYIKKQLIHKV